MSNIKNEVRRVEWNSVIYLFYPKSRKYKKQIYDNGYKIVKSSQEEFTTAAKKYADVMK